MLGHKLEMCTPRDLDAQTAWPSQQQTVTMQLRSRLLLTDAACINKIKSNFMYFPHRHGRVQGEYISGAEPCKPPPHRLRFPRIDQPSVYLSVHPLSIWKVL